MNEKQCCHTCKYSDRSPGEYPCVDCVRSGNDSHLYNWLPRESKHDRVGEKLRGNQRKGRPYIRPASAELKEEANRGN